MLNDKYAHNEAIHPSAQILMDAEAAGFAAATGKSDAKARESYIRNWGNIDILHSYEKGFADGFASKRTTQTVSC